MVNIVMVGAGGIARTHGSSLMRIPGANIVGVVDPNKERAETLASTVGATVYENLEDCVAGADVVYILTPPSTHRELVLKAIKAGKHVVCEKPMWYLYLLGRCVVCDLDDDTSRQTSRCETDDCLQQSVQKGI